MRNHIFKMPHLFKMPSPGFMTSLLLAAMLAGCSESTVSSSAAPGTPVPTVIALGTSTNSIVTDNSSTATLTATLVDSSNAVMEGVAVSFSTTSGNLNAATATTGASGQAVVTLKSGLADFSNRTATVTASVAGISASVPILIKGSTVALTLTNNTIQAGTGTLTATATAANAAGLGMSNQTIRFSIGAASTGGPWTTSLSATTLTTDATGVTPTLTFTPPVTSSAGTVVLTAEWLDSSGAVTVTATKDIIVTAAAGTAFAITTIPDNSNPLPLSIGATTTLLATVPTTIPVVVAGVTVNVTVTDVRISSTSGTWTGGCTAAGPATSILQTPGSGICGALTVAATYTAPGNSGSMTVQVDALGTVNAVPLSTLATLTRTFVISAQSTDAAHVFMSPSVSTIVPSSGSNISTTTLEATVRDASLNAVGGAAVMFGLLGTTGSGESVSPAVAITDPFGKATTTFSAGSSPTLAAIYAQASIVGEICTAAMQPDGTLSAETNGECDASPLIGSSAAVSVTVGFGTTVASVEEDTQYRLPGSVLVVDANGSPVAGATVTLTAFPIEYINGTIYLGQGLSASGTTIVPQCIGTMFVVSTTGVRYPVGFVSAEDVNRNGIMDLGEDVNGNGLLSPPQASGGAVVSAKTTDLPGTVTTDSNGAATFYLQYPKASAWFISDELTARVIVSGTESTAKTIVNPLPMLASDAFSPNCELARTATY